MPSETPQNRPESDDPAALEHPLAILGLLFAALALVLWFRLPALGLGYWSLDEPVTAAVGDAIRRGGLPYLDAVDNRGFVTYYLYAGLYAVADAAGVAGWKSLGPGLLGLIAAMGAVTYAIGRRVTTTASGAVAVVLLACFTCSGNYADLLALHTEWPMALLTGVAALGVWFAVMRHSRRAAAVSGVAATLAVFTKQPAALDLLVFAAGLGWLPDPAEAPRTDRLRLLGAFAAGGAAVFGVVAVVWGIHGGLDDFVLWFWTYNVEYYTSTESVGARIVLAAPWGAIRQMPWLLAAWLAGTAAVVARAIPAYRDERFAEWARSRRWVLFLVVWSIFSYAGASLSGRGFGHYYIQCFIPTALLAAGALSMTSSVTVSASLPAAFAAGILLLGAPPSYPATNYPVLGIWNDLQDRRPAPTLREVDDLTGRAVDAIQSRSAPDDPIFVWGWWPQLHDHAHRPPATRFVFSTFLAGYVPGANAAAGADDSRPVAGSWQMFTRDVRRSPPELVVDTSPCDIRGFGPRRPPQKYSVFSDLLDHYTPAVTLDVGGAPCLRIYKRNPSFSGPEI